MPSLVRWKFVDRTWTADDFDALGAFWLAVYDEADHPPQGDWRSDQLLELRLFGFPRSAAAVVGDELARRLGEARIPVEVTPDPDALVAKTKPRVGDRAPFAGFGVSALAGPLFDGLMIELRYTVVEVGATAPALRLCGSTLVVVGELRGGAVAVKAVWVDPPFTRGEAEWGTRWDLEEPLLKGFDRYRSHDRVDRQFANDMFNFSFQPPPPPNPIWRCWLWLVDVRCKGPRTGALLWWCGILAALAAVTVGLYTLDPKASGVNGPFFGLMVGLFTLIFAARFFMLEAVRLGTYAQVRASYDDQFPKPEQYEPVPPGAAAVWRADPAVRKLTAEAVEAGFVPLADAAPIPAESAGVVHRAFLAPDGVSYLALAFQFAQQFGPDRAHVWPARNYSVLFQTFSTTGSRFETFDEPPALTVLGRDDPTGRVLVVPKGTPLADAYRAHTTAVAGWLAEENARAERHEPVGAFIARQEEISAHQRRAYYAHPYSWREHIRWYLQLDAKPPAKTD